MIDEEMCTKECINIECWFRVESEKPSVKFDCESNIKTYLLNSFLTNLYNAAYDVSRLDFISERMRFNSNTPFLGVNLSIYSKICSLPKRINEIFNDECNNKTPKRRNKKWWLNTAGWECINENPVEQNALNTCPYIKPYFFTVLGPFICLEFRIPINDQINKIPDLFDKTAKNIILTLESVVSEVLSEIPFPFTNKYNLKCIESAKALFYIIKEHEYENEEESDETIITMKKKLEKQERETKALELLDMLNICNFKDVDINDEGLEQQASKDCDIYAGVC